MSNKILTENYAWTECNEPNPTPGTPVQTACGCTVPYTPGAPCVVFNGEPIYFCLPSCKDDFIANPRNSCMAERF